MNIKTETNGIGSGSFVTPGLDNLPNGILKYRYDRSNVTASHVHIGLGSFALAHIAAIADKYMSETGNLDWGIIGVAMHNRGTIDGLKKAQNRIVLVQRENETETVSVLGSLLETIFVPDDPALLIKTIARPMTKLLTFTVTSSGHYMRDQTGTLNMTATEIVHDLDYRGDPDDSPKTIYWVIAKALEERMKLEDQSGVPLPLTVLSLDNIPTNSKALKKAAIQYIRASYENPHKLLEWIENRVDFRVTVVDRITPKDTVEFHNEFLAQYGFDPTVLIATEKKWQLAVEKGRFWVPEWTKIGVKEVEDIQKIWQAKFFGLNAAHQILGTFGLRLGLQFIHEAMEIPELAELVALFHRELGTFLGYDVMKEYGETVRSRFADRALKDQNRRVVKDARKKASERVAYAFEMVLENSNGVTLARAATHTFAGWLLNIDCVDERGIEFVQDDPDLVRLKEISDDIAQWLHGDQEDRGVAHILRHIGELFGDNRMIMLASKSSFVQELAWSLRELAASGTIVATRKLLSSSR